MADGEALGGCLGALLMIVVIVAAAIVAIAVFGSIGALFGSGVSIGNYFKSFSENVSLEKPSI